MDEHVFESVYEHMSVYKCKNLVNGLRDLAHILPSV